MQDKRILVKLNLDWDLPEGFTFVQEGTPEDDGSIVNTLTIDLSNRSYHWEVHTDEGVGSGGGALEHLDPEVDNVFLESYRDK